MRMFCEQEGDYWDAMGTAQWKLFSIQWCKLAGGAIVIKNGHKMWLEYKGREQYKCTVPSHYELLLFKYILPKSDTTVSANWPD
jgi:hypothetical protein